MTNTMTTAWEIREAAGTKWNCDKMEIVFGMCLVMAHKGEKIMAGIVGRSTTCKLGRSLFEFEITETKKWAKGNQSRTYLDVTDIYDTRIIDSIYIDHTDNAKIDTFDLKIKTDSGTVVVECSNTSRAKKESIETAIKELLKL